MECSNHRRTTAVILCLPSDLGDNHALSFGTIVARMIWNIIYVAMECQLVMLQLVVNLRLHEIQQGILLFSNRHID